jgi:hypothetical protein
LSSSTLKKNLLILALILVSSCGDQSEEEVERGIHSAITDLTSGSCQRAIDTLNEIGYQSTNIRYLKTYASAYSCRADYSTPTFFSTDLALIGNPSALGGFSRFSTADTMNQPEEGSYRDMRTAINSLLYAGAIPVNVHPTIQERKRLLDDELLKDLHAQLFYLIMNQFGKFLYYYGDSSSTGVKGSGSGSNNCLLNYDMSISYDAATIGDYLNAGLTGACTSSEDGHPDMGPDGSSLDVERMCEGVVWFNNIITLLPEVLANTAGTDFSSISAIQTDLDTALQTFATNTGSNAVNMYSQTSCVDSFTADDSDLQIYYAVIFESLFQ